MFGKQHKGYVDIVDELQTNFSLSEPHIIGKQNKREFVTLFRAFLRMRNLLSSSDEFKGKQILSDRDIQDLYRSLSGY